jgi:hypothetical protein
MKLHTPFWVFPLMPFMLAYGLMTWLACWLYATLYLPYKDFWKYCLIGGITAGLGTLALWFGRERLGINVAILNPVVVIIFFLVKYVLYKKTKMLGGI